ncbi:MAG: L-serine ammonia-lyase, partial [Xanthomonadales bacterium]|nr:L-serine ammonia-lyase [Xanthomonadales bacterium]
MSVSIFDLFKIGIGPSSSHTVGPMRAAARFTEHWLDEKGELDQVARVRCELFGSLALTGRGHGTDKAVLLGFEGQWPDQVDPDAIPATLERIRAAKQLNLGGKHVIGFDEKRDLVFNKRQKLPYHVNGMRFSAYDADGNEIASRDYYSVGGGFVVNPDEAAADRIVADTTKVTYPFASGDELLETCEREGITIAQLMLANEQAWRSEADIRSGLLTIWQAMQDCVARGLRSPGELPGGLHVIRRAPKLYADLQQRHDDEAPDPLVQLDWVNLFALAVNEENAAGGRVVTAPTNGAAGIVPAVLHYYDQFCPKSNADGILEFLLTAGAIEQATPTSP